jgi:hypothetical protein
MLIGLLMLFEVNLIFRLEKRILKVHQAKSHHQVNNLLLQIIMDQKMMTRKAIILKIPNILAENLESILSIFLNMLKDQVKYLMAKIHFHLN